MPSTPEHPPPFSWSPSIYESDRAIGLAVCVAHRGAHQVYLGGCHALPPQRPPYTVPLRACRVDPSCRLADGTHTHAVTSRVDLDPDALADAIVRASRAVRAERGTEQRGGSDRPEREPRPGNGDIFGRYDQ